MPAMAGRAASPRAAGSVQTYLEQFSANAGQLTAAGVIALLVSLLITVSGVEAAFKAQIEAAGGAEATGGVPGGGRRGTRGAVEELVPVVAFQAAVDEVVDLLVRNSRCDGDDTHIHGSGIVRQRRRW